MESPINLQSVGPYLVPGDIPVVSIAESNLLYCRSNSEIKFCVFLDSFCSQGPVHRSREKIALLYTTAKIVVVFLVKTWSNINFWSAKNFGPAPDKQSLTPSGSDFKTDQNTFERGEAYPRAIILYTSCF